MKPPRFANNRPSEAGQSFLIVVVFILVVLLGVMGIAIDYSQVWAHRQMAQGAADAACQAAAADLYRAAVARTTYSWVGSAFDCSTNTSSAPCKYAQFNGYTGSGVAVSFPSSLPGVTTLPSAFGVTNPYVEVNITDPVPMSLSKLLGAPANFNVTAKAGCGIIIVSQRIPLLVLNLNNSPTFQTNGTSSITIEGGPQRSIQVNSSSATAASVSGTVDLHLAGPNSTGGDFAVGGAETSPATPSPLNVGTTGTWVKSAMPLNDPFANYAPPSKPSSAGTAFPVAFAVNGCPDPTGCVEFTAGDYTACSTANKVSAFANACPASPGFQTVLGSQWLPNHAYSKGDLIVPSTNNPNNYMFQVTGPGTSGGTQPTTWSSATVKTPTNTVNDGTVQWTNMGPINTSPTTAIFDPGIYYMGFSGLSPASNTTLRTSTAAGDGTGGVMFYFNSTNSLNIGSNTGKSPACASITAGNTSWTPSSPGCIAAYTSAGTSTLGLVANLPLMCSTTSPPNPAGVPATVSGNVLLGPCSGPSPGQSTNYFGGTDPTGTYSGPSRGFLFFQNRAAAANGGSCSAGLSPGGSCAVLGGGGAFIFSGYAYFHYVNGMTGTACGTNMSCLTFAGGSGSSSLTLGNMVVDEIGLTGNSQITMILNSWASFPILKPSLLE